MSENKINSLTPEQEALIPVYREKWRAIALSTEPIDRQKAAEAVKAAYALIDKSEPDIVIIDSPYAITAFGELESKFGSQLCSQLYNQLEHRIWRELSSQIKDIVVFQLRSQLGLELGRQLQEQVINQLIAQHREEGVALMNQLISQQDQQDELQEIPFWSDGINDLWMRIQFDLDSDDIIDFEIVGITGSLYEFCISVLKCVHSKIKWETYQLLVKECGWIFPFEKTCIVCDRPIKLLVDNRYRLHAEGEPAIEFADGWNLYSYHGVTLPEKYGKQHPNEWRSQWLLEETNAELRRVLIQGIGYDRISQELQAIELDSWQEYTLTKIDNAQDEEAIYLLKMTCPSTGFIHILRVPPNINSAREAIRWVNWGIDPEEFYVQT